MVFVVNSEDKGLKEVKDILEDMGHEVATFDSAESALDLIETLQEPELIVTEVEMKGMDGFEFKRAYNWAYPNNTTPFVFYSEKADEADILRGVELGADDYIIKPATKRMLSIRLKAVLKRRQRYLIHSFYADAGKLPFFRLMQFCESSGLTGEVEIQAEGQEPIILSFRAGQMQSDETDDEVLMGVYDLKQGMFIIRALPMDYQELKEFAVTDYAPETEAEVYAEQEKPMGKLSGVQVEKRLFQLQTEFVTEPSNQIVTIVVVDGRVVNKKINSVTGGKIDKRELEKMIEQQHVAVEKEIREKLVALSKKKAAAGDDAQGEFKKLFDEGFDKYRAKDLDGALKSWERAHGINPTDKTLETNIRILKKKLGIEA
ncbi:MAG TPA: response regulator [Nitrospirae bacterium]|nr:response regulator [Nitrospirota bacterium]